MRRRKADDQQQADPGVQVIDLPILPTDFSLGRLATPHGAYAVVTLSTMLTSGTFMFDRGQLVRAASEMMKLAEKMPSERKAKRLEVPGDHAPSGLVLPPNT